MSDDLAITQVHVWSNAKTTKKKSSCLRNHFTNPVANKSEDPSVDLHLHGFHYSLLAYLANYNNVYDSEIDKLSDDKQFRRLNSKLETN